MAAMKLVYPIRSPRPLVEPSARNIGLFIVVLLSIWFYRSWARHRHIRGPLLASISNIPRLRWAWSGKAHEAHIRLHEKYGKLVRIGPNSISVGDPREIAKIYGIGANLCKSDFYKVLQPLSRGKIMQGLFSTQDKILHRAMKRPIAGIYSMSNLVEFEPYVDRTICFFLKRLDQIQAQADGPCDLGTWLQWFAFDVMGEVTFSRRLGFLDRAEDVEGIIGSIWRVFWYSSWVGQMPWLDKIWLKNPLVRHLIPEKTSPVVNFALARARERTGLGVSSDKTDGSGSSISYNTRDFMSRFLEARVKDPSIPEWFVTAWTTSNVLAGSDTAAIMLRSIVYFLLRHPTSLNKLSEELVQAQREGRLSSSSGSVVTWRECQKLPYLDACIKEAGRLHPAIGLPMERVVPEGGIELCGQHLVAGTVIGMNPWVIHRDKDVFGPDAAEWNPDRWLADDKEYRLRMERCLLTFGSGHRTCIGKNIAYLEIYKLIPTLFGRYEMSLEENDENWKVTNHWLVVQTGLRVRLSQKRPPPGSNEAQALR